MVIVSDAKTEFFGNLIGERVVVFVNADVDAICAWRILKHLFKCRHILYSVLTVQNKEDLLSAYKTNNQGVSHFIFINCGANFDLVELLQPPRNTDPVFYVCDSRRPIHVNNFYNQRRIKLLVKDEQFDSVPSFDDIFRDDSSDDDSEDEEEGRPKRNRFDESYLERRIQRRAWNSKRQQILYEYENYSYFESSSACVIFDLAWKLSLDNNQLLWCCIVGSTSQLVHQRINRERYMDSLEHLQGHVTRLGHSGGGRDEGESTPTLTLEEEMGLWLYRHWSLTEALEITMLTSCQLKLFTLKGKKKMLDLLAQMGIPQRESAQKFSTMDMEIKNNLTRLFREHGERFGLNRRDLFLPSFVARCGYRSEVSALDATLVCAAVLECSENSSPSENFQAAMDVLSLSKNDVFQHGIEIAQRQLKVLAGQVQTFLDTDEIIVFGPFLYAHVAHNSLIASYVKNPLCQTLLAKYVLSIKAAIRPNLGRNRRTNQMPLILCVDRKEPGQLTLLGIPPLQGDDDRNLFGQAFEAAAKSTRSRTDHKFFDTNMVVLNKEDMLKLFEAVASMLS